MKLLGNMWTRGQGGVRGGHDQNILCTYMKVLKNKCVKSYLYTRDCIYTRTLHAAIIIKEEIMSGEEEVWE